MLRLVLAVLAVLALPDAALGAWPGSMSPEKATRIEAENTSQSGT